MIWYFASMLSISHELPAGYTLGENPHPTCEQIGVLYYPRFQQWIDQQYLEKGYAVVDAKYRASGAQSTYLDVKAADGSSIGIGCLRYNEEEGELSCLAVLPGHQRRGIGTWIVAERIRRAQDLGLKTLYIEQLSPTNTIASYYAQEGFVESNDSKNVRLFNVNTRAKLKPHLVRHLASEA